MPGKSVTMSGLTVLQDIFFKGSPALKDDIAALLTNKPVKMKYVEHIRYPISYKSDDIFWSMLLNTGYIKPCAGSTQGEFYAELVNHEVKNVLGDSIKYWFDYQEKQTPKVIQQFVTCFLNGFFYIFGFPCMDFCYLTCIFSTCLTILPSSVNPSITTEYVVGKSAV